MGNRSKQVEARKYTMKYSKVFNMDKKNIYYVQGVFDKEDWAIMNMKFVIQNLMEVHVSMNWELTCNDICMTKSLVFIKYGVADEMLDTINTIGTGKYLTQMVRIDNLQQYTQYVSEINRAQLCTPDEYKYEQPHNDNSFRYEAQLSTYPCFDEEDLGDTSDSLLADTTPTASLMSIDQLLESANALRDLDDLSVEIRNILSDHTLPLWGNLN